MSRAVALEASCVGGIVTSGGIPVAEAEILSEGIGPSTGVLIIHEDRAFYIAKTSPDLKSAIEHTISGLNGSATGLTSTVAALSSVGALPPVLAPITAAAASITAAVALLTALKETLK